MRIVTIRRICQIFFICMFLWFCIVTTLGNKWWQLRGWPVNWLLQLDPLIGLATVLTTRTLYAGLIWGVITIILTILLGRFFCGWVCPFGTLQQVTGYLSRRKHRVKVKIQDNRYRSGQKIKYWILLVLLSTSTGELLADMVRLPRSDFQQFGYLLIVGALIGAIYIAVKGMGVVKNTIFLIMAIASGWFVLSRYFSGTGLLAASLQTGLLDPIPLFYRSVNLVLLPLLDSPSHILFPSSRWYDGAFLIGSIFIIFILLNLSIPRFYCRFVCPLGALFGIISRYSLWRIGKSENTCADCHLCERYCEGACEPTRKIRVSECVLCFNCVYDCQHSLMDYGVKPSAAGEILTPDLKRREVMISLFSGIAAVPILRLQAFTESNWNPKLIRPPGALDEKDFLERCIKCGQCMRICPTNVIHPANLQTGLEALWTPALNFRIGTSGCQHNCIACGNVCPTAAIRPITLEERFGLNSFADSGPIKIGTAFIDRGRCLPWAMERPCIVCQENCPVSPKAIITRVHFSPIQIPGKLRIHRIDGNKLILDGKELNPGKFATGDYYCQISDHKRATPIKIVANTSQQLTLAPRNREQDAPIPGDEINILLRLQQPYVKPERCIGCGVCEHECPVKGLRAIRVTAENESRSKEHQLVIAR